MTYTGEDSCLHHLPAQGYVCVTRNDDELMMRQTDQLPHLFREKYDASGHSFMDLMSPAVARAEGRRSAVFRASVENNTKTRRASLGDPQYAVSWSCAGAGDGRDRHRRTGTPGGGEGGQPVRAPAPRRGWTGNGCVRELTHGGGPRYTTLTQYLMFSRVLYCVCPAGC